MDVAIPEVVEELDVEAENLEEIGVEIVEATELLEDELEA